MDRNIEKHQNDENTIAVNMKTYKRQHLYLKQNMMHNY